MAKNISLLKGKLWYNRSVGREKTANRKGEGRLGGALTLGDTVSEWSSISARILQYLYHLSKRRFLLTITAARPAVRWN
jgi:hypothetical protein